MDGAGPRLEIEISVPSETRYLRLIGRIGEDLAHAVDGYHGDLTALAHQINQVLTEAAANAMEHGNGGDPAKAVRVQIALCPGEILIRVCDQGTGFDIDRIPPPGLASPEARGRGLFIIRSLVSSVCCAPAEGGHVLELRKRLD